MQEDLVGKVVLVTDSSRGLGRHYALHLAQAAAAFGEAASGPDVAEQVRATGRRSAFSAADLTEAAQAEQLVRQAVGAFGHMAVQTGSIYAAAKAGIAHYTSCLAEELRAYAINVNCIAPAPTYTGRFLATRTVDSQEGLSRLQRIAQPEDMAKIVHFLAGPQSDYLTGETIVCWTGH